MAEEHLNTDNTFKDSVENLLSHISFAPDGGICNLMEHCNPDEVQPRKLMLIDKSALDKGFSGRATAVIALICVGINFNTTFFGATHIISCYFSHDFIHHFSGGKFSEDCPHLDEQQELSQKITLPISEIALVVAVIELSWGLMLVLDSFYRIVTFSMIQLSSDNKELTSEQRVVEGYKKYQHLATLVWNNLPELGSFSALLTLGLVHPGVIGHYARDQCRSGHRAALGLLKSYLRLGGGLKAYLRQDANDDQDKELQKLTPDQVHYLGVGTPPEIAKGD